MHSREIGESSSLAMEYKAALVIVQLTLASVYSRKSTLRDITSGKTMKLKLKFSRVFFFLSSLLRVTNNRHLHSKLKG